MFQTSLHLGGEFETKEEQTTDPSRLHLYIWEGPGASQGTGLFLLGRTMTAWATLKVRSSLLHQDSESKLTQVRDV